MADINKISNPFHETMLQVADDHPNWSPALGHELALKAKLGVTTEDAIKALDVIKGICATVGQTYMEPLPSDLLEEEDFAVLENLDKLRAKKASRIPVKKKRRRMISLDG